jgi:hypothetical protein
MRASKLLFKRVDIRSDCGQPIRGEGVLDKLQFRPTHMRDGKMNSIFHSCVLWPDYDQAVGEIDVTSNHPCSFCMEAWPFALDGARIANHAQIQPKQHTRGHSEQVGHRILRTIPVPWV